MKFQGGMAQASIVVDFVTVKPSRLNSFQTPSFFDVESKGVPRVRRPEAARTDRC
jgi:hypothetical protein